MTTLSAPTLSNDSISDNDEIPPPTLSGVCEKDDADLIIAKFGERPSLVASISSITISSIPH